MIKSVGGQYSHGELMCSCKIRGFCMVVSIRTCLLDFRRSVVQCYLERYRNLPDHPQNGFSTKESSIDFSVSDSIRLDGYMHLIQATTWDQIRRRCAAVGYLSKFEPNVNSALCVSASPAFPLFTNSETVIYFPKPLEHQ